LRVHFGSVGGLLCPLLMLNSTLPSTTIILSSAACLFSFLGELLERFLFFALSLRIECHKLSPHEQYAPQANAKEFRYYSAMGWKVNARTGPATVGVWVRSPADSARARFHCLQRLRLLLDGCGLQLHLRDGEAINLSPSVDHPVNLGMACPKGWEALTP